MTIAQLIHELQLLPEELLSWKAALTKSGSIYIESPDGSEYGYIHVKGQGAGVLSVRSLTRRSAVTPRLLP